MIDKSLLDNIIIGRVEPHIYAFTTNTIPNYLKVGDTYRPVSIRLQEWREHFPHLEKKYEHSTKIDDDTYYRDFAVHQFLESDKKKARLLPADISESVYYSREFFRDTDTSDVQEAIADIEKDYAEKTNKYQFYSASSRLPETFTFARNDTYDLRPNQDKTVKAFHEAREKGRRNLLMYAVMRFGKSFTSMCCAVDMDAKLVVVVSAKADVRLEWKKTVESHVKFGAYDFLTSKNLNANNHIITERFAAGKKVVVFLTFQDLQGDIIKDKHREVFGQKIDLLLVDETHFGARAEKYGAVIKPRNYQADIKNKKDIDDFVDIDEADQIIKVLDADTTIHLSGTPYRILMGSEFKKEDIIAFYQFTDIISDKEAWDKAHILDDSYKEWDNPYYGFPQMVRFAFHPNESSRRRLEELKKAGTTYAFSALFKPKSIKKSDEKLHKQFEFEQEILELLEVIDGSKADDKLLGFLDYEKIKEGSMCRHVVVVLPYCASCDALETLIKSNADKFRNLNEYEIINISGVDNPNAYKSPKEIKTAIRKFEEEGKKTITLTVNRLLTGSTVPQWDTMIYLKDTASPQEYDQAIFRLQNQYIKTFVDENGDTIKFNMKPQTLLVDFDPNRMFVMQETKSKIYNVNVDTGGNSELEKRIREELRISPIVTLNADKIVEVNAVDILKVVSNYQKDKGIREEALEIPTDLHILDDAEIRKVIELENEIGSKAGLSAPAHEGKDDGNEGDDYKFPENPEETDSPAPVPGDAPKAEDEQKKLKNSLKKKIQSYYARILLFAYLTKDRVISVSDIIEKIDTDDNQRIAKNLGLRKDILLRLFQKIDKFVLSGLDYKIHDLNELSHATDLSPAERANVAMSKFGKLGDAIVVTPSKICDDMVALFPDDFMRETANKNGRILDIAGTAGEYAVALQKQLTALGVENDKIANMIFTIPKSSICYELTRKLYEMLGLNVQNIASEFVATDLLEIKTDDKIDYDKIKLLLMQNKPFNTIKLTDSPSQGEDNMISFDAVVSNPPYQITIKEATEGNNKNSVDIYPEFQKIALSVADISCFIYPAKDVQRGKINTLDRKLEYLRIYNGSSRQGEKHIPNEDSIFGDNVRRIPGDVGVFLYNNNGTNEQIIYQNEKINRTNKILPIRKEFLSIANKLSSCADTFIWSTIKKVCESNFVQYHKNSVLSEVNDRALPAPEGYTKVLTNDKAGSGGTAKWYYIKTSDLDREPVKKYKIIITSAYPNEAFVNNKYIEILNKDEAFGRSKLAIYDTDNKFKAFECKKYFTTKFVKCINLMTPYKFLYYLPNFDTIYNDIDWSKPIPEIDAQLYAKYHLTPDEISFIESMIKPME